jgi:ribosomal protein S24E
MSSSVFIRFAFCLAFAFMLLSNVYAQKQLPSHPTTGSKRTPGKNEIQFLAHQFDSISYNLNKMILFEKELRQKNYFIDEKTALVEALIQLIKSMQSSIDVVAYQTDDIKKIFGKPKAKKNALWYYELETFKSNCAFMIIAVELKQKDVISIRYEVTDCQRWK